MRLDIALVQRNLCESRQEAKECIESGHVLVDDSVTYKATRRVEASTRIQVLQRRKYVSRGGEKLEGALRHLLGDESAIRNFLYNKTALDVGSSTGGFSDCLLTHGISAITAVDVGTLQLHKKIRSHANVTVFENTDIRMLDTKNRFDVVVADLSFISLDKVIDTILLYGNDTASYLLLIKPQFEVGFGNTKKGIVKDTVAVNEVLVKYTAILLEKNIHSVVFFPCSLLGGDGNQEYFIYGKK